MVLVETDTDYCRCKSKCFDTLAVNLAAGDSSSYRDGELLTEAESSRRRYARCLELCKLARKIADEELLKVAQG